MIKCNPNGIVKHFGYVCDAIASSHQPEKELREMFSAILHGFKTSMGPAWKDYFASFPPELRRVLQERYQL